MIRDRILNAGPVSEPEDAAFAALDAEHERIVRLRARAGVGEHLVRLVELPAALRADDPFTRMLMSQFVGVAGSGGARALLPDVPGQLDALRWLVRAVRRRQPPRRRGEFVRGSGWVRFGWGAVFVVWAAGGEPPSSAAWWHCRPVDRTGPAPAYRNDQPGADPASWFADCSVWWAKGERRMAAVFLGEGDEYPLLAFDPFEPGLQRPERLFCWAEVAADGGAPGAQR